MSLPGYHVARPRLTDRCRDERVVVVEAAAGYGKSVFGAELVDSWGVVPIDVLLEEGGVSAPLLASRLHASVARAGLIDAASAMAGVGDDPAGAVDTMLGALTDEACAVVIDDAHHALRDAGLLIARIAARLVGRQRLVVLARVLPPGAERLRRADALHLRASDLAVTSDETLEFCRSGFGLAVNAEAAHSLDVATGGWTAAVVLAASRSRRSGQSLDTVMSTDGRFDPIATMLEEFAAALGTTHRMLARLAPLPLVDPELLSAVTEDESFFGRAVRYGLPLTPAGGNWWHVPGPVREYLGTLGAPDTASLVRAAEYYAEHGELATALQMLLGAQEAEAAAKLLADAGPRRAEAVDALELLTVIGRIPDEVFDRHPAALFHVVRACGVAAFLEPRAKLLRRLENVTETGNPVLRRAIDAEIGTDIINSSTPLNAIPLAQRVLAGATSAEPLTRARALTVLGQAVCFRRDDDGSLTDSTLREAAGYFDQAIEAYVQMGYGEAVAGPAIERSIRTALGGGKPAEALEVLDHAIAHVAGPRRLPTLLYYRAQVFTELGRHDEAQSTLDEALRRGGQTGGLLVALVHWERMTLASYRGDAGVALDEANRVEAHRSDWWAAAGAEFLAEAADCLDRVGDAAVASEYLARAQADPQKYGGLIALSEGALLARHGDPMLADERLLVVHRQGIYPKELWRVTLLRAYAAWRRGDPAAGTLAARAFEEAARLGQPQAPMIKERALSESLLALAVETGSHAATALEAESLPLTLALLGRFELTEGGRAVPIGPGQALQLLKMVASCGGRVLVDRAIDALWPDADAATGRNRLRTVLGRLRETAREALVRDGDLLALGAGVRLDLAEFHREAREARALFAGDPGAAVAVARSAVARYRGELLPDDLYEAWAEEPREAARRAMLDVLDLCATEAARQGNLDEARRMVERSLELAPYEDDRYLRVAEILQEQGRRGAALSVLRRAKAVLAPLGIEVPVVLPRSSKTTAA